MAQVRLSDETLARGKRIRPLRDLVAVKRIEYKHPTLYVHKARTNKGIIVSVGQGWRPKRAVRVKDPLTGKEFSAQVGQEYGKFIPTTVQPGECVEFSVNGQTELEVDGEEFVVIREGSIFGYADPDDTVGCQFHESAGWYEEVRAGAQVV